jgi:hypothetical protein
MATVPFCSKPSSWHIAVPAEGSLRLDRGNQLAIDRIIAPGDGSVSGKAFALSVQVPVRKRTSSAVAEKKLDQRAYFRALAILQASRFARFAAGCARIRTAMRRKGREQDCLAGVQSFEPSVEFRPSATVALLPGTSFRHCFARNSNRATVLP